MENFITYFYCHSFSHKKFYRSGIKTAGFCLADAFQQILLAKYSLRLLQPSFSKIIL